MTHWEMLLKASHEGRAWLALVSPYLVPLAAVLGWHLPVPSYMKKKGGSDVGGNP